MKKMTHLLLGIAISIGALAQKTVIAIYDSSVTNAVSSSVYFTEEKTKKRIEFAEPDKAEVMIFYTFWKLEPIKVDSIMGTEWYTVKENVGKKFELTYIAKKVEGEGGMMNVNVISDFNLYDDAFIAFKAKYAKWKTETAKYNAANPSPGNPASVATSFITYGKKGDYKSLFGIVLNEQQTEAAKDKYRGEKSKLGVNQIKWVKNIVENNTPDGSKNEVAKEFLKAFSETSFKMFAKPVTYYLSSTQAVVAIGDFGKKKNPRYYYVTLEKIAGKWKIVCTDDNPCVKMPDSDYIGIIKNAVKESNP